MRIEDEYWQGLDGLDLANIRENLKPTDHGIIESMQHKDMEAYLADWKKKATERKIKLLL
ncbi:MAG: hypothetical protein ACLTAI_08315 [Thomasclavelia sp.]